MTTPSLTRRPPLGTSHGWPAHVHRVVQAVYAARGVLHPADAEHRLVKLLSPATLGGMHEAVELLIQAIVANRSIVIAGDYDCDGATGTAVAIRGLRMMGAQRVDYVIPNRFIHGYGLSVALVESLQPTPQLIITVDNGVASVAGVAAAKARGIDVIVTDHHLPGEQLPAADAMVNPNVFDTGRCRHQRLVCEDCARDGALNKAFPSKSIAGVGVMFYLLLATRARMREKGAFADRTEPDLSSLLDLVALGTVADLVSLDFNNRVMVQAGLKRIRSGRCCAGITALLDVAKRSAATLAASDLGFAVAPRLNAAGRLEDMRLGVECLLADDPVEAGEHAARLSAINQERRELQASMVAEAELMVGEALPAAADAVGVALYEPSWHAGVIGLVASRLKDRLHRPVVAFAPASEDQPDELRGSARSIAGFHIRDALAAIDAREPGLIERFGGHAMAAGLSLQRINYERFAQTFDAIAREWLDAQQLQSVLVTDGELTADEFTLALAQALRDAGPWGQGFPEPLFDNTFDCVQWRIMGSSHLRLSLRDPRSGQVYEAVMFNAYTGSAPPPQLRAVYQLSVNDWQGRDSLRLLLRHIEPLE